MESSISHSPPVMSIPFDLRNEIMRLKTLAEALTACVSDEPELRYKYLHQLMIIPPKQRNMLVRFSAIPRGEHGEYQKEFNAFADAMKFLTISIERIDVLINKEVGEP